MRTLISLIALLLAAGAAPAAPHLYHTESTIAGDRDCTFLIKEGRA